MNKPFSNWARVPNGNMGMDQAHVLPVTQVRVPMPEVSPPRRLEQPKTPFGEHK